MKLQQIGEFQEVKHNASVFELSSFIVSAIIKHVVKRQHTLQTLVEQQAAFSSWIAGFPEQGVEVACQLFQF